MNRCLNTAAAAAVCTMLSTTAVAQWPSHPDPGVPRTAEGEVDVDAPTPRTPAGEPDFTGLWEITRGAIGGGAASREEGQPEPPPQPPGTPPLATFFDIGANLEGGAPYRPWAKTLRDERVANGMKDNPDAHCLPLGYMQLHLHPQPRKIIQTPNVMVMIYEANYGIREIFLDGRPLPETDPQPWWYGYSVGHWEGDELVIESTYFRDGGWLDVNGSPLTDEGRIVERLRRPSFGKIEIDITIDDPKSYTERFTVRVNHQLLPDEQLIEFICNENERSTMHFDP